MSLKTKIKNDMWQVNYVVPFVKKHQFDEKGKVDMLKHAAKAYSRIKAVKVHGKRTVGNDTKALLGTINIALDKDSHFVYFLDEGKTLAIPGNILSNFTLDYDKIIHGSFKDLTERAVGSDDYGTETKAVADGIETLRMRILESVKISNNVYKKSQIEYFENMFSRPAQHFDEALQRILFFNQIMWQTRHRLNGLGRLDLILGGLYAEDVRAGSLNYDSASTLVADFLSNLSKYPEYKSDALEGDIGQIIILGGNQPDGSYFCNELTEIFLKEQANLKKPDPKTFLRVGKNMPDSLLELAVSCLTAKTGSPLFSNDEAVVPALKDFGMPDEDAYSYCVSACWEPYIVGESLDQNNVMVFDYFKALNRVLSSGQEHASFDALVDAYIKENKKCFAEFLVDVDALKWAKDPLVSMFMDGCSEKRKDVSEGAAKYNNYGITTVALSNVVDSLCNIKKLVFEEKKHTLTEMNKARVEDFANAPELFAEITALQKSYGHDDVVVESLVNRITASVAEVAKDYRNALGGTVKFGLSSPGYNILSKKMPADFSGRKSGKPYNTHISCTDAGYTEIVGFAGKLGYDRQRFNGNVIDFFMTESLIEGNIDKFVLFMKGAIASGFFQMQMNLIDSKTLIDAKVHPEKYKGLMVRVWGFSAYFNELPEGYKDLLIERAVAAERVAGVVSEYERMPTKTMKRNANTKNTEGSMEKLKYRLKNNFAVRVALFPYMNHIRKSELERYSVSSDSNSIKLWKDKYKGKRCFIVGNGPSLKPEDLDELRNEYTFGANRIYEVFDKTDWRPTFYFAVDNSFIEAETDRLNALELQNLFLAADENIDISGIGHAVRIFEFTKFKINKWNDNSAHISKDVSKYFSVGYTVTFTEIQMAIYMGFTEIILLGVDFNYSSVRDRKGRIHTKEGVIDYFSGKKYESTVLPYYSNLCAYEAAKKYADEHKIKILNATRGGKLEVFDRINFDNIVFPADNVWGGVYQLNSLLSFNLVTRIWRMAA